MASVKVYNYFSFSNCFRNYCCKVCGPSIVGLIFAIMGVNKVELKVIPFEVYLKYPLILLIVNSLVAYLSANKIKNIDFKEINNIE